MSKIMFFGQLREQLDCEDIELKVPYGMTVAQLKKHITFLYPSWGRYIHSSYLLQAVNQELVSTEYMVKEGDEIAFFPPVTGG